MSVHFKIICASLAGLFLNGCNHNPVENSDSDILIYQWKSRVIVIATPSIDTPAYSVMIDKLKSVKAGLDERDLVIVTRLRSETFQLSLIGKDGQIKYRSFEPVNPAIIFALIDSMPMRRAEMTKTQAK